MLICFPHFHLLKQVRSGMPRTERTMAAGLLARRRDAVASGVGVFNEATAVRASGATLVDADGRELIDFAAGIGVVNAGHCPPSVVDAIIDQARRFLHTSFNVVTYEPYVALCEKLNELLPHGPRTKSMLISTGDKAVENAVKIARQSTGRQGVLCFTDAFHGRTMMAMSLTSKTGYKIGCGPFAPEVYRLPFPNFYRDGAGRSMDDFVADQLRLLRESGSNLVEPGQLAAVIIELVQGEGGFNVAPPAYVAGLRRFCDEHGILLIFDEIQCGFARTGTWATWQQYGVTPDLSTYAKSLGSGMPIAAVVGGADVMDAARPSTIGGTYIGNPVSCAAALATIELMQNEDLNARAIVVGDRIRSRFLRLQEQVPAIGDVRGLGAMIAMELVHDQDPHRPDSELCHQLLAACFEEGLVLISAGTFKNIIRVLCPLVIPDEQLDRGLDIIEEQLLRVTRKQP